MKKTINIFELKFNEQGASLEDLKSMKLYLNLVNIKYYYLSKIKLKKDITPIESSRINYKNFPNKIRNIVKEINSLPKSEIVYVTSTSYALLYFVLIFLKRRDNIYLLIHFLPQKNRWLHKFFIKRIMKFITCASVPNDFVYAKVLEEMPFLKSKLKILYLYTLKNRNTLSKIKNKVLILFGSSLVESQKELVEKLDFSKFSNLEFIIVSKIDLPDLKSSNVTVVNEYISDERYLRLLNECTTIILNYSFTYSSRYSKMIYDSMEYNMRIITNYKGASFLSNLYNGFLLYDSFDKMKNLLKEVNELSNYEKPDNKFLIEKYSNSIRVTMFNSFFQGSYD